MLVVVDRYPDVACNCICKPYILSRKQLICKTMVGVDVAYAVSSCSFYILIDRRQCINHCDTLLRQKMRWSNSVSGRSLSNISTPFLPAPGFYIQRQLTRYKPLYPPTSTSTSPAISQQHTAYHPKKRKGREEEATDILGISLIFSHSVCFDVRGFVARGF